jgi:4-amino-4-deoxy-L-arabinose transferase-like glycosyltransferase
MARLKIFHLVLIFALAALPFAATFALYYPDERHYTDGALEMVKGHGWLAPKNSDGTLRFQKPPLAYWAIAASYKIFGVSVLASKLPFLLASCGTLFLTFRLARKLTDNSETALLAAIVLAAQPQFFLCSIRTIPDALLVFSITLSASGFLRLIVFDEKNAGTFYMAYFGAVLAVLSKGLLGGLIVAFAWAFVIVKEREWRAVKKIIHLPIFIVALILAGSWFIAIFCEYGAGAWRGFFSDQVTSNLHGHFWSPLIRALLFALILFFNFLPWSATAVEFLARRKILTPGAIPPTAQKFILGWTLVLILGFALGINISLRYLLPATPLFAILIADCLQRAENLRLLFSIRRILMILLALLILLDATALFIVSQWPPLRIFAAAICPPLLLMMIALGFSVARKKIPATAALGIAVLLAWLIFFVMAMPILLPDRAEQIAVALKNQNSSAKSVLLIGNLRLASRVRVCLGKNWTMTQSDRLDLANAGNFSLIVLPEKEIYHFINPRWKIERAAAQYNMPKKKELWRALISRRLPEILASYEQNICLAIRTAAKTGN